MNRNRFIEIPPLPAGVRSKLMDIINSRDLLMIAGVEWAIGNATITQGGFTISLYRPGTKFLEQIQGEGTYVHNNDNDTMSVSANTLATMLGIDKMDYANKI